jgi:hypothetical protein
LNGFPKPMSKLEVLLFSEAVVHLAMASHWRRCLILCIPLTQSTVFGVIIGAAFVQWAKWQWILWFTAILGFTIAIASIIAVPPSAPRAIKPSWKRLDLGGVSLITVAVILFVYSVTSGSTNGWVKPAVLAPLLVSVVMAIGFFVYEAAVDEDLAALPPKVWKYKNVPILIGIALLPFLWWAACTLNLVHFHVSTNIDFVRFLFPQFSSN